MNLLEIEDLFVEADGKELLRNVNLIIPEGEVHALLGQNGSGKTSLMMTIMGFSGYDITRGRIRFKGQDISDLSITQRAKLGIGISQQRPPTIQGVTLRNVLEHANKRSKLSFNIMELAREAQMQCFLDRNIHEGLSGGEIKRSELLQLLVTSPIFSMMDEPDSGLDVEALSIVGGLIHRLFSMDERCPAQQKTGLIITHSCNILKHLPVDKAHIMHKGVIGCSGNPTIILDILAASGYEACIRCMETREGV
jgi:Fe-S cluster assembly ATP-binding protein